MSGVRDKSVYVVFKMVKAYVWSASNLPEELNYDDVINDATTSLLLLLLQMRR